LILILTVLLAAGNLSTMAHSNDTVIVGNITVNPNSIVVVPAQGKYYFFRPQVQVDKTSGVPSLTLIGTLDYISPLIPVRYWAKVFLKKKLVIKQENNKWIENRGLYPIFKSQGTLKQAVIVGQKMYFQKIDGLEKNDKHAMIILFLSCYFVGLSAAFLVISIIHARRSLFLAILAAIAANIGLSFIAWPEYGGLGLIYAFIILCLGLITWIVIALILAKNKSIRQVVPD